MALEDTREIASLHQALTLLDEWISAYEALRLEHMTLMHRYLATRRDLEHARYAIDCDMWIEARLADLRAETETIE